MKGLLLKDLYTLGNFRKVLLVQLLVVGVFSIVMKGGGSYATAMVALLSSFLVTATFTYDDTAKWDRYAASLPVKRCTIVTAKYLAGTLLLAAMLAIAYAISALGVFLGGGPFQNITQVALMFANLCICLVSLAVSLPVAFGLGAEKARMASVAAYLAMGAVIIVPVFLLRTRLEALPDSAFLTAGLLALGLAAALYAGSYFLSRRLYARREF